VPALFATLAEEMQRTVNSLRQLLAVEPKKITMTALHTTTLADLMTREVRYIAPGSSLQAAAHLMA
jgi:hypothetical protein